MYAYLKGIVAYKGIDRVVVDVGGIGYNVFVSPGRLYDFPECTKEIMIYTYTCVREDEISLYGFSTMEELELFKLLISVSGIGPKGGLAILSIMTVEEVQLAILSGDAKMLSKAPGVGKKTAERIIIDLKDKVKMETLESVSLVKGNDVANLENPVAQDAVDALVALGYPAKEARKAVSEAYKVIKQDSSDADISSDCLLKLSLKYI